VGRALRGRIRVGRNVELPAWSDPVVAVERTAIRLLDAVVEFGDLGPASAVAEVVSSDAPQGLPALDGVRPGGGDVRRRVVRRRLRCLGRGGRWRLRGGRRSLLRLGGGRR